QTPVKDQIAGEENQWNIRGQFSEARGEFDVQFSRKHRIFLARRAPAESGAVDDEFRSVLMETGADPLEVAKIKQTIANSFQRSRRRRRGGAPNAGKGRLLAISDGADNLPMRSEMWRGLDEVVPDESAGAGDPTGRPGLFCEICHGSSGRSPFGQLLIHEPPGKPFVSIDAPVPQERPVGAGDVHFAQIHRDNEVFLFVGAGFGEDFARGARDKALSPELDAVAARGAFETDAIGDGDIAAVGNGVAAL